MPPNPSSESAKAPAGTGRAGNITLWTIQGLLAAGFLISGSMTLGGHWMKVRDFDLIGFGQWFRYVTGLIEFSCAIMILIPRLAWIAGALLVCLMIGAGVAHVTKLNQPLATPIVLGLLALTVAWGRRPAHRAGL